jgi:hypothetical protein
MIFRFSASLSGLPRPSETRACPFTRETGQMLRLPPVQDTEAVRT